MNRIRELLQEELNFEIINYPTPPQYSTSNKGHKKVESFYAYMSFFSALSNFRMKAVHCTLYLSDVAFRRVSCK